MTSKQRAYLKGLAMTMEPILQVGKSSITPEHTAAVAEALEARELIKINVLQHKRDRRSSGRTHQFPGRTGDRQKDRAVQRGQKREKENSASEIIRRKEPPGPEHTAAVPALFEENVWKRQTEKLALWEAHSIPFISVI